METCSTSILQCIIQLTPVQISMLHKAKLNVLCNDSINSLGINQF